MFSVFFTKTAVSDLAELYSYISENDVPSKAKKILHKLENACLGLAKNPERGRFPKELLILGIREYREIIIAPYRIIYRIYDKKVFIYLITDGRRDMQTLLQRRLFEI